jgi:hypothetical protein
LQTLLLDRTKWDLVLDAYGNIAVASEPYALAQDAASACRLFAGELWYDTRQGVPYFESILGKRPPLGLIKALLTQAAMSVPGVVAATVYLTRFADRVLTGQVQVRDQLGRTTIARFSSALPAPAAWGHDGGIGLPLRNDVSEVITDSLTQPVYVRQK